MKNKIVLVIDDSSFIRELMKCYCRRAGPICEAFADGIEAMRWIAEQTKPPDLIFLDIGLPKLDGYSVAVKIKARFPEIPIVMLTAHTGVFERLLARLAGASHFIPKPFTSVQILRTLYSLLHSPQELLTALNTLYTEQQAFICGTAQFEQLNRQFKMIYDVLTMKQVVFHHERQRGYILG